MSKSGNAKEYAIDRVIRLEGGLADHPSDPGGITKYGISLRWARGAPQDLLDINEDGIIDRRDIRAMSIIDAAEIYRSEWWDRLQMDSLPSRVAIQMLDFAVNMGGKRSTIILQRACRWHGHELVDDGIQGPKTRAAVWAISDEGGDLVPTLKAEAAGFYRMLAETKPGLRVFLRGWLRRAAEPIYFPPEKGR